MLNVFARVHVNRVADPLARRLLALGVTPDAVTVAGTVGSVASAVWFLPRDQLFVGTLLIWFFVMFDLVDGAMARARGHSTPFGAVLDSACDRAADGALFAALAWWCLGVGDNRLLGVAALVCLVSGQLVSYVKARAEGLGLSADGGLVERAERLILALVGTGLHGLGVPYALDVALWLLAVGSLVTVGQRIVSVYRSAQALPPPPSGAVTVAERLTDLEYAAAWRLVRALPEPVALGAFRLGADLAARRGGAGARQLRRNLSRAAPDADLDVLVRDGLRSYARYWCEAFRLPSMNPADVHARTRVTGLGPFAEALDDGRGVVLALVHSGNWDAAGVWLVEMLRRRGLEPSFTTVAQRLAPESVYRRFVAYREALGFEVVAADGGSATHRALTSRLRGGGVVCLLADRDVTGTGAEVSFLGAPTTMPTGPARLAAMTGALLLPTHACFTPDGWSLDFADPVPVPGRADVGKATQALADSFGTLVSRVPEDWHVLQPIWGEP